MGTDGLIDAHAYDVMVITAWMWSATILQEVVLFKQCLVVSKGPKVC